MTGGRKEYVLIHWGSRRKGSSKRIKRLLLIYHEPASSHTKSSLGDSHSETHRRPMDLLSHRAIRRIGPIGSSVLPSMKRSIILAVRRPLFRLRLSVEGACLTEMLNIQLLHLCRIVALLLRCAP